MRGQQGASQDSSSAGSTSFPGVPKIQPGIAVLVTLSFYRPLE